MSRLHILIMETDLDLCEELQDLLVYERFEISTATGVASAWQSLRLQIPDLILSCVQFADGNGFEFLARLREHPQYQAIPLIFLTGRASPEDVRQAMHLGADDYLVKPVRSQDLLQSIQARLLRMRQLGANRSLDFERHRHILLHHFPHEVFTPLNALLGSARLLKKKFRDLPPQRLEQLASVLLRNGVRLFHMLQNQLMYLELETWQQHEDSAWIRQQAQALETVAELTKLAHERADYYGRQADLQLNLVPAQVRILNKHLQVIGRELIDNAFKFSQPGTPVVVSSRCSEGQWLLKVLNTGSGLTPKQIQEIMAFQQFERQQREQQGIGLGLSLSERLLSFYGSRLQIDSRPERYTEVLFALPLWPADSEASV